MNPRNRMFTILMAEDDPDDRLIVENVFKDLGISESLRMVKNGNELLNYLEQCITCNDQQEFMIPVFILLDLKMPEKNGWETLGEIKRVGGLQDIPIVIWTGSDADEDRLRSIEMGAEYFITKPSDYSDLLSGIHSLIKLFCGDYERSQVNVPVTNGEKII